MGKGRGDGSYFGTLGLFLDYGAMVLGILCLVQLSVLKRWDTDKVAIDKLGCDDFPDGKAKDWCNKPGNFYRASMVWTIFTGVFTVVSLVLMILQAVVSLPKKCVAVIYFVLFAAWVALGMILSFVMYSTYPEILSEFAFEKSVGDIRFANTLWMATLYLFSALWNFTSSA